MAISAAALAISTVGATVYTGERQRQVQKKQLREQERSNDEQVARAVGAQKLAAQEQARLNRRKPDVATLLGKASDDAQRGAGSTLLTGASGVDNNRLLLGQKNKLGGTA